MHQGTGGSGDIMAAKDELGRFGEQLAARHFSDNGLQVLETNWRCAQGELDIIAREGDALVFCEVKTRSSTSYGTPGEAVTPQKAARIHRLAYRWMEDHEARAPQLRFDLVSIIAARGSAPVLEHVRGAF